MKALITVGTDEGDWSPPKPVELGVTATDRTGLGVTNRTEVRWQAEGRGRITRAAIALGTGDWARAGGRAWTWTASRGSPPGRTSCSRRACSPSTSTCRC